MNRLSPLPPIGSHRRSIGLPATLLLLLAFASTTQAGRNSGGALVVHTNDMIQYTTSGDYCGVHFDNPGTCEDAITRTDKDEETPAVIWLLAAFPDTSSPAVTTIQFGIDHNLPPEEGYFAKSKMCADLEMPDAGWPETGFGNLVSFGSTAHTELLFPYYFFAAYGFEGAYLGTTVYPATEGAKFVDDSVPPVEDSITRFGSVAWFAAGSNECPLNAGTGGEDGAEEEEGDDPGGQDAIPEGEPTEIVCLYLESGVLDDSDRPAEPVSVEKIEFARSGLQEALVAEGALTMWAIFPNHTSADTVGVDRNGNPVKLIDLSRFYRVRFSDPMTAEHAVPGLLDAPGVQFAYAEEAEGGTVSSPNDEHYESITTWFHIPQDAQWHLRNDGVRVKRTSSAPCDTALAGWDINAETAWDLVGYGSEHVVIGMADTEILGGARRRPDRSSRPQRRAAQAGTERLGVIPPRR